MGKIGEAVQSFEANVVPRGSLRRGMTYILTATLGLGAVGYGVGEHLLADAEQRLRSSVDYLNNTTADPLKGRLGEVKGAIDSGADKVGNGLEGVQAVGERIAPPTTAPPQRETPTTTLRPASPDEQAAPLPPTPTATLHTGP
jgi:hypothetical protein